jgi:hypothetical protein
MFRNLFQSDLGALFEDAHPGTACKSQDRLAPARFAMKCQEMP